VFVGLMKGRTCNQGRIGSIHWSCISNCSTWLHYFYREWRVRPFIFW